MDHEIDVFRQEYQKQKELEEIVVSRALIRPKTKKWHVAIYLSLLVILVVTVSYFICESNLELAHKVFLMLLSLMLIAESYLRFCLIQLVKCYQHYASENVRRTCKCIPSCSEYAILALKTIFPLFRALLKIRTRLYVTCDGSGYIVDFPSKRGNYL